MQATSGNTRRILVADGDPIIRKLITRFVEKEGFEPITFRLLVKDNDTRQNGRSQ